MTKHKHLLELERPTTAQAASHGFEDEDMTVLVRCACGRLDGAADLLTANSSVAVFRDHVIEVEGAVPARIHDGYPVWKKTRRKRAKTKRSAT